MATILGCITFDCADPRRISAFWAAALGYTTAEDTDGWITLRPVESGGPLLGFQRVPEPKAVKNRVHLDLKATGAGTMETEVERLVGLGARAVRLVAEEPDHPHMIMQDPEGNEFCVVRS
jgi:catechol 2,3-dioxygenase-like lactoylglutathione lyase family enzyme